MGKKRKQYRVMHLKFEDLVEKDGKLYFDLTGEKIHKEYANSENQFYDMLYRIKGKEYKINENGTFPMLNEFFILRVPTMSEKDIKNRSKYEKALMDGINIITNKREVCFVREGAIKSSSQTRTQKTMFIRADLKGKIDEYATLNKVPIETVIAKFETAKGLLLSSAVLIDNIPNIVIVPDHEVKLKKNVRIVEDYTPPATEIDEEEKQYRIEKEIESIKWEEFKAAKEEAKNILTQALLKGLQSRGRWEKETYKTLSNWQKEEHRRVKPKEIANPKRVTLWEGQYYANYHRNQTEEIKVFPIKPYSTGLVIKDHKDYECDINVFDGQGVASMDFMKKVSKELGLNYTTQGIQIRLPYIKGYIASFPIKKWAKDNGVSKIKDIWGKEWDLFEDKIDMIIAESCFKAKLEKSEGREPWLFSSMKDYTGSLKEYGYRKLGIAAYTKKDQSKYTTLTYQHLFSFNLKKSDMKELIQETWDLAREVKNGNNIAFTKAYLNILADYDGDENVESDEEFVNVIHKALDLNDRMLFDAHVRYFLVNQSKKIYENLMLGRAYVEAQYKYAVGDLIAFMEHSFGLPVKGFLGERQCFSKGEVGERIGIRNPITHYSEVLKSELIDSDNEYIQHLTQIIQFPAGKDLSMSRMNLDYDGDKILITDNEVLKRTMIESDVIYNPSDKSTASSLKYNLDNIIKYELMNLHNLTSSVTNICTHFSNKAMEETKDLTSRDYEIALMKHFQGLVIDSAKSMKKIEIPEALAIAARKKPYFLSKKYGDFNKNPHKYQNPIGAKSLLNILTKYIEKLISTSFKMCKNKPIIDVDYLDIQNTKDLLQDESQYTSKEFFRVIKELKPIYEQFIEKKSAIDFEKAEINHLDKSDKNKDEIERINEIYKKMYEDIKNRCLEVCSNESILASCCVEIAYNYTKNSNDSGFKRNNDYSFPWRIASNGLLKNIESNNKDELNIGVVKYKSKSNLVTGDVSKTFTILGTSFRDVMIQRKAIENPEFDIKQADNVRQLKDYRVKLIKFEGKSIDDVLSSLKDKFTLTVRDQDVTLFVKDKYVASIRHEDIARLEDNVNLKKDYIGQEFVISNVIEKGNKNIIISMNNVI